MKNIRQGEKDCSLRKNATMRVRILCHTLIPTTQMTYLVCIPVHSLFNCAREKSLSVHVIYVICVVDLKDTPSPKI